MGMINGITVENVSDMFGIGSKSFKDRIEALEKDVEKLRKAILSSYMELEQCRSKSGGRIDPGAPQAFQESSPDMRVSSIGKDFTEFIHYGFRFWSNGRGKLKYVTLPVRGCSVKFTPSGNYEVVLRKLQDEKMSRKVLDSLLLSPGGRESNVDIDRKITVPDIHPHCCIQFRNRFAVTNVCNGNNPWPSTLRKPEGKDVLLLGMGRLYKWLTEINYDDCYGNLDVCFNLPPSEFSRRDPDPDLVNRYLELSKGVLSFKDSLEEHLSGTMDLRGDVIRFLEDWLKHDDGDDSFISSEDAYDLITRRFGKKWFGEDLESPADLELRWAGSSRIRRYPLMQAAEELRDFVAWTKHGAYASHMLALVLLGILLSSRKAMSSSGSGYLKTEVAWDLVLMQKGIHDYTSDLRNLSEYVPYDEFSKPLSTLTGDRSFKVVFRHLADVLEKVTGLLEDN